MIDMIYLTAIG